MRFVSIAVAAGLMAISAPSLAQAPLGVPSGEYVLDKTHASLTWKINHLGLSNYTARFTGFDATINLNAQDLTKSTINVTIDPKTVRTDFPFPEKEDFDKVIAEKFLQASAHPQISFKSKSLAATGPKTGKLTGDLTFLGVTKPVVLDVTLNGAMPHPMTKVPSLGLSASGSFKRSDFGMTAMQGALGDEVHLLIETEFNKK